MSGYSNQLKSNASLMLKKDLKKEVERVIGAEYSIELPQALMGLYRDLTAEEELFKCI